MSSTKVGSDGLGRASALLASGTLVSRLLGFVKAAVLAQTIGQLAVGDAFAIGNQLPNNVYALVAGGVLSAVLIPQIVRAGQHDDAGQSFINKVLTLGTVVFLAITVVATLAAPLLVALYTQSAAESGRGFSSDGVALATAFAYWCLPQILFYALYSLLGEVLNARRAFGPFAWAPVINNIVSIAGLVVFSLLFGGAEASTNPGAWTVPMVATLAGSATLGIVAQAGVLAFFWRRTGLSYRPDFVWRGVGLARTGKAAGWLFAMLLVSQLAGIVQSNVTTLSSNDGPSVLALQNAWLVFMVPHSVIALSVVTVYFTRMSGHASTDNVAGLRDDVSTSLRSIGLLLVFAAATLIVAAYPLSRFFESSFEGVQAMGNVIIAYAVGLVPFSTVLILQRVFFALEEARTVFFIDLVKSALFVVGSLACASLPSDRVGVGMALVSSGVAFANFAVTFAVLRRRLGRLDGKLVTRRLVQYLAAAVTASLVGFGVLALLGGMHTGGFAVANPASALLSIGIIGAVMAAVYGVLLVVMRNPELGGVLTTVSARFRPSRSE
ncbi:MAG: mviN [Homoserinimonas sp.]|nr:mviN [Homoserinimonas sp.]